MKTTNGLTGEIISADAPYWTPLESVLSREQCGYYMWMGEILLENGLRIHAYKHYNTRRYLHIGVDGSSWLYEFARYIPATVPPTEQHEADVRELEERHAA